LHLLFSLYLGYERPSHAGGFEIGVDADGAIRSGAVERQQSRPPSDIALFLSDPDTHRSPNLWLLLTEFFDEPQVLPSLHEKFVGFTGAFTFGSRGACFAEVRRRGGVPCSPAPYIDYMFVSREHEQQGAASSQVVAAIYFRRLYGTPLVLRERVWESLTNAG
jgi:hypothetical protein